MNENTLFLILIGIIIIDFLLDTLLDYLNARRFSAPIPAGLTDVFDPQEYEKSQKYKKANYKFGQITSTISLVALIAFLSLNGFAYVDFLARELFDHPVLVGLAFFGILLLAGDILSLPFSYFHTFVIEEQFGFNKTTKKTFFLDKLKGWGMMIVLGGLILSLVIGFYQWTGQNFWWYAWILVSVVSVFLNMFYSRLIVPLFNKQTPLPEGSLREKIEAYARREGFDLENIFVIDGSKRSTKANAYFSGFGREKRITLYDTLINDLDEEEIVAVLAHEVGHYRKNHILINLLLSILVTGFTLWLLSLFVESPLLSGALGVSQPSFHVSLVAFALLYSPVSTITGLLMNYLSRKFEYQADDFAKSTFDAGALVGGLKKLSKKSLSNLTPHPAYVFVHYSHPPLALRLANLEK